MYMLVLSISGAFESIIMPSCVKALSTWFALLCPIFFFWLCLAPVSRSIQQHSAPCFCVLCFVSMCTHVHTHTHVHTKFHSHTHSLSLTHSLTHSLILTHSLSHTLALTHSPFSSFTNFFLFFNVVTGTQARAQQPSSAYGARPCLLGSCLRLQCQYGPGVPLVGGGCLLCPRSWRRW